MNTTKALGSLKGVFSSIHQPLPLSKNESQKLLSALKTSFRSKLDKEYGWDPEEAPTARRPASSQNVTSRPTQGAQHHHRPTDRHMHSILSNPLFKQAKKALDRAPAPRRDPMDVFDDAVSKGLMTRRGATGCLMAKRREILQSSSLSTQGAMADAGAGRRVVQWLRTSGEERSGGFLADEPLMKELTPFMLAEGLEEVIWSWAHRLAKEEGLFLAGDSDGPLLAQLLSRLVDAKSQIAGDQRLDTAYAALLRAEETWRANRNLSMIMQQPWRYLSWASTVEAWNRPRPSDGLFESYVAISEHIQTPVKLDLAHLDLHHPTRPSHEKALQFFRADSWFWETDAELSGKQACRRERFVNRVVSMGMDTIKDLTQAGRLEEADWVTRLLRTKLANQFDGHPAVPVF